MKYYVDVGEVEISSEDLARTLLLERIKAVAYYLSQGVVITVPDQSSDVTEDELPTEAEIEEMYPEEVNQGFCPSDVVDGLFSDQDPDWLYCSDIFEVEVYVDSGSEGNSLWLKIRGADENIGWEAGEEEFLDKAFSKLNLDRNLKWYLEDKSSNRHDLSIESPEQEYRINGLAPGEYRLKLEVEPDFQRQLDEV